MLVVLLRGNNVSFWYRLECQGSSANISQMALHGFGVVSVN